MKFTYNSLIYITFNKASFKVIYNKIFKALFNSNIMKNYNLKKEKIKLQETLAKVSHLLVKSNGDTTPLKGDGGVQYEVYEKADRKQIEGLAHFRVTQALRVSCVTSGNALILRHYGSNLHSPRNA